MFQTSPSPAADSGRAQLVQFGVLITVAVLAAVLHCSDLANRLPVPMNDAGVQTPVVGMGLDGAGPIPASRTATFGPLPLRYWAGTFTPGLQLSLLPPFRARLCINTASAGALTALPGIGPKTAQALVSFRLVHGDFRSLQRITAVKGIGATKLKRMLPLISLHRVESFNTNESSH